MADRARLPRQFLQTALLVASLSSARLAAAASCSSTDLFSTCFDANALWLPGGRAAFVSLPDTQLTARHAWSGGITTELIRGPVRLHVPSPDFEGRDVRVVDYASQATFLFAFGLVRNVELSLALPFRVYQNGAGAGGITSQAAPPLAHSALSDPRLSIAYSLDEALATERLGLRLGLDVAFPLADQDAFAGGPGFSGGPNATLAYSISRLSLRAGLGLRLRRSVDFGDVRLGSQAFAAVALGADLLRPGQLFLGLEAFALPGLTSATPATAGPQATSSTLLPAEWLASVSSNVISPEWSLRIAGGTGLPFSSQTRTDQAGTTTAHFLGLTSPEFRALLSVRFTPRAP